MEYKHELSVLNAERARFAQAFQAAEETDIKEENIHISHLGKAGSNTDNIYRISLPTEPVKRLKGDQLEDTNRGLSTFICKSLKGCKLEAQNLEKLNPFITQYRATRTQHPSYAISFAAMKECFCAGGYQFVLFEEASGESAFDFAMEWALRDYNPDAIGFSHDEIVRRLNEHFERMGRYVAEFHLKFGEFDESTKTFRSHTHNDLHMSNFFYNKISWHTTFIDYETMASSINVKQNISVDIQRLFSFSRDEIEKLVDEKARIQFMKNRIDILLDDKAIEAQNQQAQVHIDRLNNFFKALKKGYEKAFKDAGYECEIDVRAGTIAITKL